MQEPFSRGSPPPRDGNSGAGFVIAAACGNWFKNFKLLKTYTPSDYVVVAELQQCRSPF
jgi:hypothetical protein